MPIAVTTDHSHFLWKYGKQGYIPIIVLIIIVSIFVLCFIIYRIYFKNNQSQNQEEVGNIELGGVQIELFHISTFPIEGDYDSECCICYDEFIDDDEIMILPVCRHIYHPHYITP